MQTPSRHIYSVSQLNQSARLLLEQSFPLIWVEGEISNLARPSSGHIYFSLKDSQAQIRCAMFAMRSRLVNFKIDNGQHVLVRAKVSLYEGRGDYQLIVEHLEEAGNGALQRAFEELKQRLAAEGLFDTAHKKRLPKLPKAIGVITSPSGAAIRDILSVLRRRFPGIPVYIYPTAVQGQAAAAQVVQAIQLANQHRQCDVLILARGGGSIEDLWPFNEEIVARAIFASELPIVSGVGHEIDFTIADFVADQRAPTPSAAAELCSPDCQEWLFSLTQLAQRLQQLILNQLQQYSQTVLWLSKRLQHPGQRLREQSQRLDDLEQRLHRAHQHYLRHQASKIAELKAKLQRHIPIFYLEQLKTQHAMLHLRLQQAITGKLEQGKVKLAHLAHTLETVSPLATLQRGYVIARHTGSTKIVNSIKDVQPAAALTLLLADGQLNCTVNTVQEKTG